jgi:hypothetical protein
MIPQNPKVVLELSPDGRVSLQANIDNTIAIYGMLVAGMDAVQKRNEDGAKGNGVVAVAADALKQLQGVG